LYSCITLVVSIFKLFPDIANNYSHVDDWEGEWNPYIWASVAVWLFDRLITICRLAFLNWKVFLGKRSGSIEYHAEQDFLRINVNPSFHFKPLPGTYYFLYFPSMWRGWESHPFTLSSWTGSDKETCSEHKAITSISSLQGQFDTKDGTTVTARSSTIGSDLSTDEGIKFSFLVKPYRGFTSKLKQSVIQAGNSKQLPILIEGPYGEKHTLYRHENVILIAGGSGITASVPYLHELLNGKTGISSPQVKTKRIHIVFSARTKGFMLDVLAKELRSAMTRLEVTMDLAITRMESSEDEVNGDILKNDVNLSFKRLDIPAIIRSQAAEAVGETAVFVCGPAKMADQARRTVVDITGETKDNQVHYYEEVFGW
jgi:predicted ferric reductase